VTGAESSLGLLPINIALICVIMYISIGTTMAIIRLIHDGQTSRSRGQQRSARFARFFGF
jgi:hypothetical protein